MCGSGDGELGGDMRDETGSREERGHRYTLLLGRLALELFHSLGIRV